MSTVAVSRDKYFVLQNIFIRVYDLIRTPESQNCKISATGCVKLIGFKYDESVQIIIFS